MHTVFVDFPGQIVLNAMLSSLRASRTLVEVIRAGRVEAILPRFSMVFRCVEVILGDWLWGGVEAIILGVEAIIWGVEAIIGGLRQ